MRRWIIIAAISLFMVSLLVECEHDESDEGNVELALNEDFQQTPINCIAQWRKRKSKSDLVKSAVREFEVQHQNVYVNLKFKEAMIEEAESNKLVVEDSVVSMIKSGNYAWDIIVLTRNTYKVVANQLDDPLWGEKYLVNFEDYDWFRENHISNVFKIDQYRNDYGGILAGPLIAGEYYGLWYNEETARKIGITVKKMGMTFDDLLNYCKKVYTYNQEASEKISFLPVYKLNSQVTYIFNSLVLSELGELGDEKPDGELVKSAIKKGLEALEQLSKYYPVNPDVVTDHELKQSLNGQLLFALKPSYWYNKCETTDPQESLNLVPAELPVFQGSASVYPGTFQSSWGVFKNSPHRDAAVELIKFFTSNDVAERWLNTTYNPTGLRVKLKASDFGLNDIEKFNNYIEQKYGENIYLFDLGELIFHKQGIVMEPQKVLTGELSSSEYYESIISQL